MVQSGSRLVLSRLNERNCSAYAAAVDEEPHNSSQAVSCSSLDAAGSLALVGGIRSTTSALLLFVCISNDANRFICAGAALTTDVSKLQRDVTELKTYSQQNNATGKLSKMEIKIEL